MLGTPLEPSQISPVELEKIVRLALKEDIGEGDVTTNCTVPSDIVLSGRLIVKTKGVIAGLRVAKLAFLLLDGRIEFISNIKDGEFVKEGQVIATIRGPGRAILTGERVALNFLQRMSGIASLTHEFVDAVRETSAVILDTRKTAPGLRILDKWAVSLGGGHNHRLGLYDIVLIKENHIVAAGSISEALRRVRAGNIKGLPVEVEVKTLNELKEALTLGVDRILLDNMGLDEMVKAVQIADGLVPLEASGNIKLNNVQKIAMTEISYISVGMLTHSSKALDISLLL